MWLKIAGYCPYIPVSEPAANERTFFDITICANSPLLEIEMLSMQIRCGFEMVYEFAGRTPVVLMLNVHPYAGERHDQARPASHRTRVAGDTISGCVRQI